jgi:signal transduction protein with GAF and PtsI domain
MAELLVGEAERLGETIDVYVSRAVAMRLVSNLESRDDRRHEGFRSAFEREGLMPPFTPEGGQSVLRDPERLQSVAETGMLDTTASDFFDHVVALAAEALGAPSAAIAVVEEDQQIYWSSFGMETVGVYAHAIPLERSIARYIVASGEPLIVPDARSDATLRHHPTVQDGPLRAYLGYPLTSAAGHTIGALSVADTRPHHWGLAHFEILEAFAEKVCQRIFASGDHPL